VTEQKVTCWTSCLHVCNHPPYPPSSADFCMASFAGRDVIQ